jgi:hypothetical protein
MVCLVCPASPLAREQQDAKHRVSRCSSWPPQLPRTTLSLTTSSEGPKQSTIEQVLWTKLLAGWNPLETLLDHINNTDYNKTISTILITAVYAIYKLVPSYHTVIE